MTDTNMAYRPCEAHVGILKLDFDRAQEIAIDYVHWEVLTFTGPLA